MAKIIIWDSNTTRATEYQKNFAGISNEILKVTTSKDDLDDCKIFFRHSNDSIDDVENDTKYTNAIKFEFSGGGLTSEINKEEFPFEAKLESWKDIFRIWDIIDKGSFTIDDVYYILGLDPKLEKLLEPFAKLCPFDTKLPIAKDSEGNEIKKNGKTLNIKEVLTDYVKNKIAK